MAQFDVREGPAGSGLLLDCQADLLSHLNTRLVVPLMLPPEAPVPAGRLNPSFRLADATYVMVTQFAGAIEASKLGPVVATLADHDREIMNALDVLLTGV